MDKNNCVKCACSGLTVPTVPTVSILATTTTMPVKAEQYPDWFAWLMLHAFGTTYNSMQIGGVRMWIMAPHVTSDGTDLCMPPAAAHMPAWWATTADKTRLCGYLGIRTVDIIVNGVCYTFDQNYYVGLGRLPRLEQLVQGPPATVPQAFTLSMPRHVVGPDEMATRLAQLYTGLAEPWHRVYFGTAEFVSVLKFGDWQLYACERTAACLTL